MYCLAAFVIIGALWSTPSVQSIDCTDQDVLKSEMTKCISQSGLSVDAYSAADELSARLTIACSNTEALKSALSCIMGIGRNCLMSLRQDPTILPHTDKMSDGIDYFCDHLADYDAECFRRTVPTISKCVELKTHAVSSVSRDRSLKFVMCKYFDAALDCARQNLGVCPRRTKEIVLNNIMYNLPPACSGGTSAVGASCVFLLFAALLAVICRY